MENEIVEQVNVQIEDEAGVIEIRMLDRIETILSKYVEG
ncbi:hypothetical protein P3T35_005639 [Kitasatospora sp. GP30]|nr:hypothetical protein [Kitasatospora sp. GP30]